MNTMKVRFDMKGDKVMPIALYPNGRQMPLFTPIDRRQQARLVEALTQGPITVVIEDNTPPSRGPGRPRTGSMGNGGLTAGMSRGAGNGRTAKRTAAATAAAPRKRGRPRRTPIS